jgi:cytochrome c oxidase cbb3-type subunit 3
METLDMNDAPDPLLLDHEADGIRELDNQLPRWWVWLFYLTIIFSAIYLCYYHVLRAGDLSQAEYSKEMAKGDLIKSNAMARFEVTMASLQPSKDEKLLATGKDLFMRMCAPCHRPDGGGLVGPNLTDDYWVHGPQYSDNLKVIWNGVPEKGMVTWKGLLKPDEIHAVASFIHTLRGTKPPNPKPPENQAPAEQGPNPYE